MIAGPKLQAERKWSVSLHGPDIVTENLMANQQFMLHKGHRSANAESQGLQDFFF